MDNYKELFDTVEKIQSILEVREKLLAKRQDMSERTKAYFNAIVEEYHAKEEQLEECRAEAEKEYTANQKELMELTKQQYRAETAGNNFEGAARIKELEARNASYNVRMEALDQLKAEVVVPADKLKALKQYRHNGIGISQQIYGLSRELVNLLGNIKGELADKCLAGIDLYVMGRQMNFVPEVFEELKNMRKETEDDE